jgi:hypothetical protein
MEERAALKAKIGAVTPFMKPPGEPPVKDLRTMRIMIRIGRAGRASPGISVRPRAEGTAEPPA